MLFPQLCRWDTTKLSYNRKINSQEFHAAFSLPESLRQVRSWDMAITCDNHGIMPYYLSLLEAVADGISQNNN